MTDYYVPWGGRLPRLFIDENGEPMSGATLSAYKARTTTPINMYDGIAGDTIGTSVVVSGGDTAGYIERDTVELTGADNAISVSADAATLTADLDDPGGPTSVYAGAVDLVLLDEDLTASTYEKLGLNVLGLAVSKGYAYVADVNEVLRKYSPLGTQLWTYNFTTQLASGYTMLAVDPAGNAYLRQTGNLRKISSGGSLQWTYSDTPGGAGSVCVNDLGDSWVCGWDGSNAYWVDRVDTSGNRTWRHTADFDPDVPRMLAVDSNYNVYVECSGRLVSLNSAGTLRWKNTSLPSSNSVGVVVSTDDAYVFVAYENNQVKKIDTTNGTVATTYTEPAPGGRDVRSMAINGNDYLYVGTKTPSGGGKAYLRKIDISDMSVLATYSSLPDTNNDINQLAADPGHFPPFYS